jgi:hypothetical protein
MRALDNFTGILLGLASLFPSEEHNPGQVVYESHYVRWTLVKQN